MSGSPTSLLHLRRPATLAPQQSPQDTLSVEPTQVTRTTSQKPKKRRASVVTGQCPASHSSNAVASGSRGPSYLNVPATTSSSTDQAAADMSPITSPTRQVTETCSQFLSCCIEVAGQAISKDQWQPDSSSALCSFALCTTNFGPAGHYSYFSLGPRRHHCRKCGKLYCSAHSSQRAPLVTTVAGKREVSKERVCDECFPRSDELSIASRSRRSSACSEDSSNSTVPSDSIVTPEPEDSAFSVYLTTPLSRSSTRANLQVSVEPISELAPVEPWMGDEGVLSLYPLAVNASHAKKRSTQPAAGPLFGPSIAAKRNAKEKELERASLRQRRLGNDKSFWIPGAWGYKREHFDPTYFDGDVDPEVEVEGGLVVDGPIRFRAPAKRLASPARTPSEERPAVF